MKKILVTGGAGFIGSNLCRRLLDDGHKVICIDNFYTSLKDNIIELLDNPNFKFIFADVTDKLQITQYQDIDEIYNLACPASPPHYQRNPLYTLDISYTGTANVLDLAKSTKAKLLHTSTSEIYGDPLEHPQTETYWGNVNSIGIRSCYDEGKRVAETMLMDHHRTYNTRIKIVRIFNTYGTWMDPEDGRVVSNFIVQALKGEDITIYGDGHQTRSFCYIDDMVNGLIAMMESDDSFIGPVNLGNPNEFTVKELANLVMQKIETKGKLIFKDLPQDDPKVRKPDISLAKEKLNWEPKIHLYEGLDKAIKYFQEILNNG